MTEPTPLGRRAVVGPAGRGRGLSVVSETARSCVVLLGMPHSGVEVCARILAVLGVDTGEAFEPQPKMASECELNGRILDLFGRGYQTPFHDLQLPAAWWTDARLRPVKRELSGLLRARAEEHGSFAITDPQTARLLPLWQQALRELNIAAKGVVCLRNPGHVARALAEEEGLASEIGEVRWLTYMVDILKGFENFEAPVIEYETWFREPRANVAKLRRSLGLAWDQSGADLDTVLAGIIEPRRGPHQQEGAEARLPLVRSFYELLRRCDEDAGAREELLSTADRIVLYRQLNRPLEQEFETLSRLAASPSGGERAAEVREELPLAERNAINQSLQVASAGVGNDAGGAPPPAARSEPPEGPNSQAGGLTQVEGPSLQPVWGAHVWRRVRSLWERFGRAPHEAALADAASRSEALAAQRAALAAANQRLEETSAHLDDATLRLAEARGALARTEREAADRGSVAETYRVELRELRREMHGRNMALAAVEDRAAERERELARARSEHDRHRLAAEAEVATLRAAAAEAGLARARAEGEAAARAAAVAATRSGLAALREELNRKEAELDEAGEQAAAMTARSTALQSDLAEQQAARNRLEAQLAERDTAMREAETALAERAQAVLRVQEDLFARASEVTELRAALAERDALLASGQAEAPALRAALAAADENLAEHRNVAAAAEAETAALRAALAAAEEKFAEREQMLAAATQGIAKLQAELDALHSALDASTRAVTLRDATLAQVEGEVAEHRRLAADAEAEIAAIRYTLAAAEEDLAERDRMLAQAEEAARERDAHDRAEIDALRGELAAREGALFAAVDRAEELASGITLTEAALAEREAELGRTREALVAADEERNALEVSLAAADAALETAKREAADKDARARSGTVALREQLAERGAALLRAERSLDDRERGVAAVRAELVSLQAELAYREAELARAEQAAADPRDETEAVQAELVALRDALAARNTFLRDVSGRAAEALSSLDSIEASLGERDRALALVEAELARREDAFARSNSRARRRS